MQLPFSAQSVARALIVAVLIVHGLSLGFLLLWFTGHDHVLGLAPKFDPRYEVSVPTWLSSTILAACAVTLGVICSAKRKIGDRFWMHWRVLAGGFLLLSVDEAAEIHERLLGDLSKATLGRPTQLWAVFGIAIAFVVGVAFLRFLFHLPNRSRKQFILAAAFFLGGALVVELLGLAFLQREQEAIALALSFIEETFEVCGASLFLYSLFDYANNEAPEDGLVAAAAPSGAA